MASWMTIRRFINRIRFRYARPRRSDSQPSLKCVMAVWRCVVFGFMVAASLGGQSASAEPIGMPADAKAWMKFEAGACPDADGDDCLGSTLIGPNPPNGIPMSTFGSGDSLGTGFAEILPGRIRSFARGQSVFMHSSFEDTYTVRGTAAEPFNIPVEFHATGVARSQGRACPSPICNQLVGANGEVKIGTFNVLPSGQFSEGLRVSEFGPQARALSQAGASAAVWPRDVSPCGACGKTTPTSTSGVPLGGYWRGDLD